MFEITLYKNYTLLKSQVDVICFHVFFINYLVSQLVLMNSELRIQNQKLWKLVNCFVLWEPVYSLRFRFRLLYTLVRPRRKLRSFILSRVFWVSVHPHTFLTCSVFFLEDYRFRRCYFTYFIICYLKRYEYTYLLISLFTCHIRLEDTH